jgi:hypothetical protein
MKIIRVFPRKTSATPDDQNVRIACQPGLFDEADEIHIPVIFTYDMEKAEQLEKMWRQVAPVKVGGPACGDPGGGFYSWVIFERWMGDNKQRLLQ